MILGKLKEQFGFSGALPYVLLMSPKEKLYLVNRDIERIELSKLRIDAMGVYFGEYGKGMLRLSIEGAQLVGKHCTKNVVEISERETKQWLMGKDVEKDLLLSGFVILKCQEDFLGCGKYAEKDKKILNYIPKSRRILAE